MIRTRNSRVIPAPPDEIYALLVDPARRSRLSRHRMEVVSEGELRNGLRSAHFRMQGPTGGTVDTHSSTVEKVESERIVFRTMVSPLSFNRLPLLRAGVAETESTIALEPHGDGTLLVFEQRMQVRPLRVRLFAELFGRRFVRQQSDDSVERIRAQFV